MKETKGILILLAGSLIWGVAFVAQSAAADLVESFTFNGVRFVLAALTLLVVIMIRKATGNAPVIEKTGAKSNTVLAGVVTGVFLFIASNLQQLGIGIYPDGVAVAGRSGFITATYVVLVAVVGFFIHKKLEPLGAVCSCRLYGGVVSAVFIRWNRPNLYR